MTLLGYLKGLNGKKNRACVRCRDYLYPAFSVLAKMNTQLLPLRFELVGHPHTTVGQLSLLADFRALPA